MDALDGPFENENGACYSCGKSSCPCFCAGDACWRIFLLVVNVVLTVLAVVMICYLAVSYSSGSANPLITEAYFGSQVGFLVVIVVLALIGISCMSEKVSGRGKATTAMYVFLGFTIALFIAELFLTVIALGVSVKAKEAENQPYDVNNIIDHDVELWAQNHESVWYSAQTYMGCCGYNSTTGYLATGFLCTNPSLTLQVCRPEVLNLAEQRFASVGALGVLVVLLQALGVIAAICLACCMRSRGGHDELSDRKQLIGETGDTSQGF